MLDGQLRQRVQGESALGASLCTSTWYRHSIRLTTTHHEDAHRILLAHHWCHEGVAALVLPHHSIEESRTSALIRDQFAGC